MPPEAPNVPLQVNACIGSNQLPPPLLKPLRWKSPNGEEANFSIAYFFAGHKRHNDIGDFIARWCDSYEDIKLRMVEIDTLRGGKDHDLSASDMRQRYLDDVEEGKHHTVISTPPCSGFSRVLYANNRGPKPLRNRRYPWGFPWLTAGDRRKVEKDNALIKFNFQVLKAVASAGGMGLTEHPEAPAQHPEAL